MLKSQSSVSRLSLQNAQTWLLIIRPLPFPSGTTAPEASACVSTRRSVQDSLAVVLVCARDSRARLRSHAAAHLLSLSNESLVCPTGRTTPLHTRRYSPGVLGDIRAALAHDAPPGPESPGIPGLCKTHSLPAVVVTAITSRTEKREFRRKHRPMRTLDTD